MRHLQIGLTTQRQLVAIASLSEQSSNSPVDALLRQQTLSYTIVAKAVNTVSALVWLLNKHVQLAVNIRAISYTSIGTVRQFSGRRQRLYERYRSREHYEHYQRQYYQRQYYQRQRRPFQTNSLLNCYSNKPLCLLSSLFLLTSVCLYLRQDAKTAGSVQRRKRRIIRMAVTVVQIQIQIQTTNTCSQRVYIRVLDSYGSGRVRTQSYRYSLYCSQLMLRIATKLIVYSSS